MRHSARELWRGLRTILTRSDLWTTQSMRQSICSSPTPSGFAFTVPLHGPSKSCTPAPWSHISLNWHHFAQTGAAEDAAKAIDYALKAAGRFTALHQHDDAVGSYELARAVLLRSAPDPKQHCELLLGLASAQQRAGRNRETRANLEQAAELARRIGTPDLLARAGLGYGAARSWGETGVVNHTLVSLLEHALRTLPAHQCGLRARVQARLAEEIYDLAPDQRRAPIRAAVVAARRSRDPAVLARVLLSRRFSLWTPETLEQRRDATKAVELAHKAEDLEVAAQGIGWLIGDLLELGHVVEADLQIQASWRSS